MRYTKELEQKVRSDIKYGLTPQKCAEKYDVPVSVVLKWNNMEIPTQRAREIALRKYQAEVSESEALLTDRLAFAMRDDLSDDEYFRVCGESSDILYSLATAIVKKERDLNPHEDPPSDAELIAEIASRWQGNKFIRKYAV